MIYRLSVWCVCLLSLVLPGQLTGQSLPRKGSLGIAVFELNDSLQALTGAKQGIYIGAVMPGSTAAQAGLRVGDVLTGIDGGALNRRDDLQRRGGDWMAGADISFDIWRDGQAAQLTGKIKGKPRETSPHGEVRYEAVSFRDGRLRSIIHKLYGAGPFPTVVYLQGYTCGSIDYYYDDAFPVRQLVDGLVERGFAVLRVEKPGVGDSEGTPDCNEIGYQTEIEAFDAALSHFEEYPFVDPARIFYFGHSLGGIAAPILAVDHQPRGVIVYGAIAKSWYEYLMDIFRDQNYRTGADPTETEANMRRIIPLLYQYMIEKKSPDDLRADPALSAALPLLGLEGDQVLNRHFSFWQELQGYDLTAAWREAGVATLALYGEHDIQAISADGAKMIAQIVNTYHPGLAEWRIVPGTEHIMTTVPSMKTYVQMRADGRFNRQYMGEHFNRDIIPLIVEWMEKAPAQSTGR